MQTTTTQNNFGFSLIVICFITFYPSTIIALFERNLPDFLDLVVSIHRLLKFISKWGINAVFFEFGSELLLQGVNFGTVRAFHHDHSLLTLPLVVCFNSFPFGQALEANRTALRFVKGVASAILVDVGSNFNASIGILFFEFGIERVEEQLIIELVVREFVGEAESISFEVLQVESVGEDGDFLFSGKEHLDEQLLFS